MKNSGLFSASVAGLLLLLTHQINPVENKYGLKKGNASVQSINALAFGPDGILFIGDSKEGAIIAIDTKDKTVAEKATAVEIKNIDQKIAAALGTETKNIRILDLAVNPLSKKVYVAVQNIDGNSVLLVLEGDKIQPVSLNDIQHSRIAINNLPGADMKDRGGRPLRDQSISDLGYSN